MNSQFDYRDFLEVFAAWDAAYQIERAAVECLYRAKLQDTADEREVGWLLAELSARRSTSDELLALLAAQFDELVLSSKGVH
jgi:hypothetical protein